MQINKVEFENFRNLKNNKIEFSPETNIIFGNNAQGKTNLLECIWLFSGLKSFRGSKDNDFIAFNEDFMRICSEFFSMERNQKSEIFISKEKKEIKLNNIKKQSLIDLSASFSAVVFAPSHLSLIKNGPENRRKFIDSAISQIKPNFNNIILKYNKTLNQRNALLKEIQFHRELIDTLDIWDDQLSYLGGTIIYERLQYLEKLQLEALKIHTCLSENKENFKLNYNFSFKIKNICDKIDIIESFDRSLKNKRSEDLSNRFTSCGPHRDDIDIFINDNSVKTYGSQGQQRSCAISLKLAEANILKNSFKEAPIILLDDVLSELDSKRQKFLLNQINSCQVFITCCERASVERLKCGKIFSVDDGFIKNIN